MVLVGTGTSGTAVLKTKYPVTDGLIAGTTKQEGRQINQVAEEEILVYSKEEKLL
jgi:predicted TIM-barrel enzyme